MSMDEWHHVMATFQQQRETAQTVLAALGSEAPQSVYEVLNTALEALHVADAERQQHLVAMAEAQQATAAMAQRYQALFDLAPDGYLVTDSQGIIQEANRAAAALLAVRQESLVGQPFALFVVPEERPAFRTQLVALDQVQHLQGWSVRLQPREGQPFDAELTVAAVSHLQGQRPSLLWHLRDIMARQQAEAARRDSDTRLHAILQTAADGIITIDERGIIASFNPAAERLFGYAANDVIGQNVRMLMPLPYREEHDGYLAQYLRTGEPHIIGMGREVRARRRDGTTFPIALAVSEMHLDGRRMFTGILHDLTERVRMEEALRQPALLIDLSYDPIFVWDEKRGIVLWNQGCERLYGFPKAEAMGRDSHALLHTVFPVSFEAFTTALWRDGHWSGEVQHTTRDGREVIVESRFQVVKMDERWVVLEIVRDITARKQAEAALRASEARFRTMADAAPVLVWMAGPDMGCTYFNQGWLDFTGRTMDQERGNGWAEGVHPDDYARCVATYHTAFAARQPFEMEYRLRRADGTYRWVLNRGVPLLESGECFDGYIGCAIDITERKAAEVVLRHTQEELERRVQERTAALTAANEEIRRFAYIVSHDLRAPLINLKGFASELRNASTVLTEALPALVPHLEGRLAAEVTRTLDGDIPEALGFIETAVTRMDRLIEAVLQLSRLGQRELHLESVDTAHLVQDTLRTLAHQLTARQVQVTMGSLPVVQADALALSQLFGNLLANAVAYLDPSRPGALAITATRHPEKIAFTVQDNGRGIAAADMPYIFEPFRRVGRQDVPGEGMGLAYVQMLVRRHGGEITCQSTLGEGTTFTFTIAQARPDRSLEQ